MIKPKPHIEALYRTPDDTESRFSFLRLDKNERIVAMPPPIMDRFHKLMNADTIMAYPELEPLYLKIASFFGVAREELLLVAGSDLGIKTVYETYIAPDDQIVLHTPTYAMQDVYSKIFQARVTRVGYGVDLQLNPAAFSDAITEQTRMVVLENPNGFAGTLLPTTAIRSIVKKARDCGTLVLLDEAYYLFSGQTIQSLYREFDNVIISRTFSKDLGIAGLRCAYLLSQKQNIDHLYRVKPMHEINSAAVAFAIACLEHPDLLKQYVDQVRAGLETLRNGLHQLGLKTAGGTGNFIVTYVGDQSDIPAMIRQLKSDGVLVRRPFQVDCLKGWLRVGAGTPSQMERFLNSFSKALKKPQGKVSR